MAWAGSGSIDIKTRVLNLRDTCSNFSVFRSVPTKINFHNNLLVAIKSNSNEIELIF